jgi:hypothetical protein
LQCQLRGICCLEALGSCKVLCSLRSQVHFEQGAGIKLPAKSRNLLFNGGLVCQHLLQLPRAFCAQTSRSRRFYLHCQTETYELYRKVVNCH